MHSWVMVFKLTDYLDKRKGMYGTSTPVIKEANQLLNQYKKAIYHYDLSLKFVAQGIKKNNDYNFNKDLLTQKEISLLGKLNSEQNIELDLVKNSLDIVFANEQEITSLINAKSFDEIIIEKNI